MKSIQSKLTVLIMLGIAISVLLLGIIGTTSAQEIIDHNSVQIMNSISGEKAQQINNTIGRVEQSVDILSRYVFDNIDCSEGFSCEKTDEYAASFENLVLTTAHETDGAVSVYVRFNPELASPKAGIFKVINPATNEFEDAEITDISAYSPDDTEHVGWYYEPVNAGCAIWMNPYYNKNIDMYMISYVTPVYKDGILIGVVGMDIDFEYLTKATDSIKIYNTGLAFLTDINFNIIYHRDIKAGVSILQFSESFTDAHNAVTASSETLFEYTFDNVRKKAAFSMLDNGMCLAVSAPVTEIDATRNEFVNKIFIVAFLVMAVFFLITSSVARKIVQPLKELTVAAQKISDGNLDVTLNCSSKDEVGTLTESFRETVRQLKIRIDYINSLAYLDKLTDIQNNTAYIHAVSEIKQEIEKGTAEFAVAVIDLNGLKYINDNYGHDSGNWFIITAAELICDVFGKDNVYRTGGDEFAVLLRNEQTADADRLEKQFFDLLEEPRRNIKVSAALGVSVYDRSSDNDYDAVFRRADKLMYECKEQMKSRGETSVILM